MSLSSPDAEAGRTREGGRRQRSFFFAFWPDDARDEMLICELLVGGVEPEGQALE